MKLLSLDGNSVINRAYFGVKPLTNREGRPTVEKVCRPCEINNYKKINSPKKIYNN